jgi:DNA-binding transcriptional LysR family regulator
MALKDLYRMGVFAKVIEHGSFSAAGAALALGKSAVSHHIAELERAVGVKLLNRSTRSMILTEEGRRFHENCRQIATIADQAFLDLDALAESPHGKIRMTAPYALGLMFLTSCLARFHDRYPEIEIDLALDDLIVDLIAGGYDVGLRVGWLRDRRLRATRLAPLQMIVCAAPAYLARHGAPRTPDDLVRHRWIGMTQLPQPYRLALKHRGGLRRTVRIRPMVKVNSTVATRQFLLEGEGMGFVPDYAVQADIDQGRLLHLLPDWRSLEGGAIWLVFPHRAHRPLRVRLLVEFLKAEFSRR